VEKLDRDMIDDSTKATLDESDTRRKRHSTKAILDESELQVADGMCAEGRPLRL